MNTATQQNKPALPLCKECAHFMGLSQNQRFSYCAAPQHGVDLVYGEPVMPACEHQRESDRIGRCGQSGVFFVAKASASAETSEASTAFKAHTQQAPAQPVQPMKLPESTTDIDWRDSDEPACRPAIRMEIDISDGNSVTHIQQSVYRETDTDPLMQLPPNLHIGWHGTQTVIDEAGREWTRTFGPCVIDNFGSLADCFTGEPA